MKISPIVMLAAGALSIAVPTVASASVNAAATSVPMTSADDDDRDFPWGLLGLIGLAGLLGRKRDDRRTDDNVRR